MHACFILLIEISEGMCLDMTRMYKYRIVTKINPEFYCKVYFKELHSFNYWSKRKDKKRYFILKLKENTSAIQRLWICPLFAENHNVFMVSFSCTRLKASDVRIPLQMHSFSKLLSITFSWTIIFLLNQLRNVIYIK